MADTLAKRVREQVSNRCVTTAGSAFLGGGSTYRNGMLQHGTDWPIYVYRRDKLRRRARGWTEAGEDERCGSVNSFSSSSFLSFDSLILAT